MKKASFIILILIELVCAAFSLGQIYFWVEKGYGFFIGLAVYLSALLFLAICWILVDCLFALTQWGESAQFSLSCIDRMP